MHSERASRSGSRGGLSWPQFLLQKCRVVADHRRVLRPISHIVIFGWIMVVIVEFLRTIASLDVSPPQRADGATVGPAAKRSRFSRPGGVFQEGNEASAVERFRGGDRGKIAKRGKQIDELHNAFRSRVCGRLR